MESRLITNYICMTLLIKEISRLILVRSHPLLVAPCFQQSQVHFAFMRFEQHQFELPQEQELGLRQVRGWVH